MTETEKANAKLVKEFVLGWTAESYDLETEFPKYLKPDALVRMPRHMDPMHGAVATVDAMRAFMTGGAGVNRIDIQDLWAHGPIVAMARTDFVTMPDNAPRTFEVSAVFIVADGRIAEWTEYMD